MMNTVRLSANGLNFHALTAGDPSAPLLVFLHGFPEYSGAWEEMLDRLSDEYFCVAPDQRGYGLSDKPEGVGSYVAGKLAADAAAILSHFAPKAHAVIGHDWGASVAYALAIGRPELMARLIILNGVHPIPFQKALAAGGAQAAASQYIDRLRSAKAEEKLAAENFALLARMFGEGMEMGWLSGARLEAYREAWAQPGALTGMLNWYRATPLRVAAPGVPIPAEELPVMDPAALRVRPAHLLIWGLGDTALLPEAHEGLAELCDDFTYAPVEDADHWIAHQKPDLVAGLIRDFCARPVG